MAIKEGNERVVFTIDSKTKDKLLFLCKFFNLSKTKCINKLIAYMYEKLK